MHTNKEEIDKEIEKEKEKQKQKIKKLNSKKNKKIVISSAQDIVRLIPNTQRELFNFDIDWKIVDKTEIIETVMRNWLNDRFREYLGQEEDVLVNFVVELLKKHNSGTKVVTQLRMVLDKDTEQFVQKMWRRLIFETLKAIHNV
eukprot:312979_1